MTQDTIKDRLRAARALIDKPEKWTQGRYFDNMYGVESYCASGALSEAALTPDEGNKAWTHLYNSVERHTGRNWGGLVAWNDAPERTHAEVMQAFDRAIDGDG